MSITIAWVLYATATALGLLPAGVVNLSAVYGTKEIFSLF